MFFNQALDGLIFLYRDGVLYKLSHYIGTFRVFIFVFVYSNYIPVFVKYRFMARTSSQIYKLKGEARGTTSKQCSL